MKSFAGRSIPGQIVSVVVDDIELLVIDLLVVTKLKTEYKL